MSSAMRVYLDDEPLRTGGLTLTDAVEAGRAAAEARGRLIVEVWADGAPAPPEHLDDPPDIAPYAEEVRFVSVPPGLLVSSALDEAADELERVRETQKRAAERIDEGKGREAMESVVDCLQGWQAARRAIDDGCGVLGLAPGELLGEGDRGGRARRAIDGLVSALKELQRAVRDGDIASLSDSLAYDLDDLADEWIGLLREMAKRARDVKTGGEA